MRLSWVRVLQQSWHTIIQPSVLWVAPRVVVSVPVLAQRAHVPMGVLRGGLWVGGLLMSRRVGCVIQTWKNIYEI